MKYNFIYILVILAIAGCKKKIDYTCPICSCIDTSNNITPTANIDSATFYQSILGTWYLQQSDTIIENAGCNSECYCDTQHPFIFLPNNTLIMSFGGGIKDTFEYTFTSLVAHTIAPQSGFFFIPGDIPRQCQITYTSNYLAITMLYPSGLIPPPNYYLTRH